ncbi:MAG: hypothetical protein M3O46_16605, partial [Myxococcota bacterium]|nr:hypothetical protein [Myxococcota bacterium]
RGGPSGDGFAGDVEVSAALRCRSSSVGEIEQVEQVADGRRVRWRVRIRPVLDRIRQVVAAALGDRMQSNEVGVLSHTGPHVTALSV